MRDFNNYQVLSGYGVVVIKEEMVSFKDIERVNKACTAVKIYENRTIVSFFPLEYLIDDRRGIKNPIGEIGERLEVRGLIIICGKGGTFNLKELIKVS